MNIPKALRYASTHEWVTDVQDGEVTVGITDFAQDQLGDVVFVELPEVGARFATGDPVAVVESVKTASDINAPLAGEITAVNDALEGAPERINEDPYEAGWLFRMKVDDAGARDGLLDAEGYRAVAEEES